MISTTEFKNGLAIELEGQLWVIAEFQHVKPGKGSAFVRTKLRRMRDGGIVEKTFRAGEKFQDAYIEKRKLQYLYRSDDKLHVMDGSTYEQSELPASVLGEQIGFLKENMELEGQFHNDKLLSLEVPTFVDVAVTETEPGIRGDTSKSGMKPAVIETGASVQVPLFVNKGDHIRVDTRTASYVSRI